MSVFAPSHRRFCPVLVFGLLLAGDASGILGQESPEPPKRLDSLPERFFQVQDDTGFLWQALDNGALVSGDAQYLQSGMNLIVDGEPFAPSSGTVREPGSAGDRIDLRLEEVRGEVGLTRDLWFDTRRSGVRILDAITNRSGSDRRFEVVLRTTYPFAWQSLHGGGRMLAGEPGPQLSEVDRGLAVHFSPSDGRHDTYFLFGSGRGGVRPKLKASANSRELLLSYELDVPSGQTRSLLHWILQRNLPDAGDESAVFPPFLQRDQLIQPGIEAGEVGTVANFDASAFPAEAGVPSRLRSLVALNDLAERVGSQRRSEDLLWQGPTSQMAGAMEREGTLVVDAVALGEVGFPLSDLAALRGGAGQGIAPLFFLRDGRVLAGARREGDLIWKSGAGETEGPGTSLDPEEIHLLLLATAAQDGTPPDSASHFVQLHWGSVVAVDAEESGPLGWIAMIGGAASSWRDVAELERFPSPSPHWRVRLADGSLFVAMPPAGEVRIRSAVGGELSVPGVAIERIWKVGEIPQLRESDSEGWIEFSEVPGGLGPSKGFLLSGNQLVAGTFAAEEILLLDGDASVRLETSKILGLRRDEAADRGRSVEVQLLDGNRVEGEFGESYLRLSALGTEIEVPSSSVLGFRKEAPEP